MWQLLGDLSPKSQSSMLVIHCINVRMHCIPKVDELKVNWDDNVCELILKKCH